MTVDTRSTVADIRAALAAAGIAAPAKARKQALLDLLHPEAALSLAPEQAESAALPAEEPVAADSPAEPVAQPEKVADAVRDWRGNYNTVLAPAAEMIAAGVDGLDVWTVNVSAMLKQTHIAGPGAAGLAASLGETEALALAALKTWMKTLDRKDATDMERYNQNRSFLSGYLGAVVQEVTDSKKTPVVPFAKDMDRALRTDALKAGAAARKVVA